MANPSDFFAQMMPYAQRVSQQTGLDPRLVLAQAALETGYGRSAPGNNFFGIKSHNRGGGNTLQTQEFEGGRMVTKPQSFRGYETPAQSFEDYGRFLQENPRYKPVLAAGTIEEQIAAMARSGYATDPNYGQKLASIASRVDPNAPVNIASDAMRAIGRPSGGGLLASNETVSTQGRTAGQGEPMAEERGLLGGLLNPDRRDRLIMALEGMTLNPNQALIQASGEAIKGRAESQQSKQAANRTAAWLRSQGREDLAAAVEIGAVSGRDAASAALQPADQVKGVEINGRLVNPVTGQVIADFAGDESGMTTAVQSLHQRALAGGLEPGSPEYRQFMVEGGAQNGMSLQVGADGSVSFGTGSQAMKPLTEGQSKDTTYAVRAEGALPTLDRYDTALANLGDRALDLDPTGLIRGGAQSNEYQLAKQAGDEFLQAILRKDTGAAITQDEQVLYGNTYLPKPGDGPEVIEQKRSARARALAALKAGMPPSAIVAQERALQQSGAAPAAGGGSKRMRFNPETGQLEAVQ